MFVVHMLLKNFGVPLTLLVANSAYLGICKYTQVADDFMSDF